MRLHFIRIIDLNKNKTASQNYASNFICFFYSIIHNILKSSIHFVHIEHPRFSLCFFTWSYIRLFPLDQNAFRLKLSNFKNRDAQFENYYFDWLSFNIWIEKWFSFQKAFGIVPFWRLQIWIQSFLKFTNKKNIICTVLAKLNSNGSQYFSFFNL